MPDNDVSLLKANIKNIYSRKLKVLLGISLEFAGLALKRFRQKQPFGPGVKGEFWNNQAGIAASGVFSGPIKTNTEVGFFLSHDVEYGVYLELANNRKYQSLFPTVVAFYSRFIRDLEELYGG